MTASSVTGRGKGSAKTMTSKELAMLGNAPTIIFAGTTATSAISSPPSNGNNGVVFPYSLPGGSDKYVVVLTGLNSGASFVTSMDEDDDGNFIGFQCTSETEGTVMYIVTKIGSRPNL